MLKPAETGHVSIALNHHSLAYWSVEWHGWKVDPGKFTVYLGDSSENILLQVDFPLREAAKLNQELSRTSTHSTGP